MGLLISFDLNMSSIKKKMLDMRPNRVEGYEYKNL